MGKGFDKFLNMIRLNDEDYDDYDDYDDFDDDYEDEFEDIPAPVVKKKTFKKESSESKHETKYRNTRLRSSLHRRLQQHRHLPPAVRLSQ